MIEGVRNGNSNQARQNMTSLKQENIFVILGVDKFEFIREGVQYCKRIS